MDPTTDYFANVPDFERIEVVGYDLLRIFGPSGAGHHKCEGQVLQKDAIMRAIEVISKGNYKICGNFNERI